MFHQNLIVNDRVRVRKKFNRYEEIMKKRTNDNDNLVHFKGCSKEKYS